MLGVTLGSLYVDAQGYVPALFRFASSVLLRGGRGVAGR